MSKPKKKHLYMEIQVNHDSEDHFNTYTNQDGKYVVEYFGDIVDFHFHFGPGPDNIESEAPTKISDIFNQNG